MNRTWLVSKFKSTQSDWWFGICFIFPYIGNVIIPFDELIFFRGVGIPPTSHVKQGLNTKKWHWSRSTHADPNGVSCSKVRELRKMRCSSAPLKPVYTPIQCWAPTWSHLSSNPLLFFNQDAPEKIQAENGETGKVCARGCSQLWTCSSHRIWRIVLRKVWQSSCWSGERLVVST